MVAKWKAFVNSTGNYNNNEHDVNDDNENDFT